MAVCPECKQEIKESVAVGRKLIVQLHTGPHTPPGTGRYLTVFNLACACGSRREMRYENRRLGVQQVER
jgi:hypothetical protein